MAGITDQAYRRMMTKLGAEVLTTELISAESFVHGSHRTREMMVVHPEETFTGVQLVGSNVENLITTALTIQDSRAKFIDLNLGCPVPKVNRKGAGAALLKEPKKLKNILHELKKELSIPLSIKIRSGWDSASINAEEILTIAEGEGIAWVTLHGRTREQGYSGYANWKLIEKLHKKFLIPIVGNGDIQSAMQACQKQSMTSAVMIGRAALANPFIFLECQQFLGRNLIIPSKIETVQQYFELVQSYHHPKVAHMKLKKMYTWFAAGYSEKAQFRKKLFSLGSELEEILKVSLDFFHNSKPITDTFQLDFLKGGHG